MNDTFCVLYVIVRGRTDKCRIHTMIEITIAKCEYDAFPNTWEWKITIDGQFKGSCTLCESAKQAAEQAGQMIEWLQEAGKM